jgi:hypothetical protein
MWFIFNTKYDIISILVYIQDKRGSLARLAAKSASINYYERKNIPT